MADKIDGVAGEFEKALSQLRQDGSSALGETARLHELMNSLLQHEAQRIQRKLGAGHARTRELKASVEANVRMAIGLKLQGELARIDVPAVSDNAALIHGRVVDDDDLGIDKLMILLVDRSGAPLRETSGSTADSSGYFSIALEPEIVDRLTKQYPDGVFLAVVTPLRRTVYQHPTPLALVRGSRLLIQAVRLKRDDLISVPSRSVKVPKLVGLTLREAKSTISGAGVALGTVSGPSPTDESMVVKQEPPAAAEMPVGTAINLTIRPPRTAGGSGKRQRRSPAPGPQGTGNRESGEV